jgi:hypothetical protein
MLYLGEARGKFAMAQILDTGSWPIITGIATATLAVLTATNAGVWKIMEGQVKHWKELYDAKAADLESVRRDPKEYAAKYIAIFEEAVSEQIAKLEDSVRSLRPRLWTRKKKSADLRHKLKSRKSA